MSSPSQIFLMVETVVLLLRPLIILLKVDCVTPLMVHSMLIVIPLVSHISIMRCLTAEPIVTQNTLSNIGYNDINRFELTSLPQLS